MKLNIVCKLSLDGSPSSQLAGISSALASVNDGILIWNEAETQGENIRIQSL